MIFASEQLKDFKILFLLYFIATDLYNVKRYWKKYILVPKIKICTIKVCYKIKKFYRNFITLKKRRKKTPKKHDTSVQNWETYRIINNKTCIY